MCETQYTHYTLHITCISSYTCEDTHIIPPVSQANSPVGSSVSMLLIFSNTDEPTKQLNAGIVNMQQHSVSCDQSSSLQNYPLKLVQIKLVIAGNAAAV